MNIEVRRQRFLGGAIATLALAIAILGMATTAYAVGTVVFSAPAPAAGATIATRPGWIAVMADDTKPVTSATMTLNGLPLVVTLDYPVGHFEYDEEQESNVWVGDDPTVVRLMSYSPNTKVVLGANTVVAKVTSANGTATYSWSFNYGSVTTVGSVTPTAGAVLAESPTEVTAGLNTAAPSFSTTMRLDGTIVPTIYIAGTKTFKRVLPSALAPGIHTVVFTALDSYGATASKTWTFEVQAPSMANAAKVSCTSCHNTFPAAHPVDVCAACHTHGYVVVGGDHGGGQIPTVAGCTGDGVVNAASACHRLDHGGSFFQGSGPFACTDCHSATYANVPRHQGNHENPASSCDTCHSNSLITEHGKYPKASSSKYQCDVCHGPNVRQQVKDAIIARNTSCSACHGAADGITAHTALKGACTNCHPTFATAHPLAGCNDCHDHAYADPIRHGGRVPTVTGCTGDGVVNQYSACHQFEHGGDFFQGSGPFTCIQCHSATNVNVPRHWVPSN